MYYPDCDMVRIKKNQFVANRKEVAAAGFSLVY